MNIDTIAETHYADEERKRDTLESLHELRLIRARQRNAQELEDVCGKTHVFFEEAYITAYEITGGDGYNTERGRLYVSTDVAECAFEYAVQGHQNAKKIPPQADEVEIWADNKTELWVDYTEDREEYAIVYLTNRLPEYE